MSEADTTLLESWENKSEGGFTRISLSGDGHCIAIVNAVVGNYSRLSGRPRPTTADLFAKVGEKVTLIMDGSNQFGAGMVKSREGTLLEIANDDPDVTGFSYFADIVTSSEDEEIYWDPTYTVEGSEQDPWEYLREVTADENVVRLAFESDSRWEGRITVERIRAIFAGESSAVSGSGIPKQQPKEKK